MKPKLCTTPNQQIAEPQLVIDSNTHTVHVVGYDIFTVSKFNTFPSNKRNLDKKFSLLNQHFTKEKLRGKSLLDLGCSTGAIALNANHSGADLVTAIDIDPKQLEILNKIIATFKFPIKVYKCNVTDWSEPHDIVCALALIHWIYSCTSMMGSLDNAISLLRSLTKETLFIEWIAPNDSAIEFFGHISYNREFIKAPYNKRLFVEALVNHFKEVQLLGVLTLTREIYVCHT